MAQDTDQAFNANRMNNLSYELKKFIAKTEKCRYLESDFPLIHYFFLEPYFLKLKKNHWSEKDIAALLKKDFEKTEFCMAQFRNFIQNASSYYGVKSKLKIIETRNLINYYLDENYTRLRVANRLLYWKESHASRIIRRERHAVIHDRKEKIFLLGTEDFGNLGDHFIAQTEVEFLKKAGRGKDIIEITASQFFTRLEWLKNHIGQGDIIALTGGGNMENLYPFAEKIRTEVIHAFPKNKIVIFPQTIFYDERICSDEKENLLNIYDKENIVLAVREKYSYQLVKDFKHARTMLIPDIVFWNQLPQNHVKREQILICLRSDKEAKLSKTQQLQIEEAAKSKMKVCRYDTQFPYDIGSGIRAQDLDTCIQVFQSSRLVITDRLQGLRSWKMNFEL